MQGRLQVGVKKKNIKGRRNKQKKSNKNYSHFTGWLGSFANTFSIKVRLSLDNVIHCYKIKLFINSLHESP